MNRRALAGRALISLVAAQLLFGVFWFDYNKTHVFNPTWTDHARFHTGMTIFMGAIMAVLSLYYAWRRAGDARTNLQAAAWLASLYFLSFFPSATLRGSSFTEPGMDVPLAFGLIPPQLLEGGISLVAVVTGYLLAAPRNAPARES